MLAFSAVTQFPINGSSTCGASEGVQASTSAEHVMTAERRKIRIAGAGALLATSSPDSRAGTRAKPPCSHTSAEPGCCARMRAVFVSPKVSPTRESADMVKPVCHGVENYT